MPLDENEAWERMRAAILRYQADPTPENHAEYLRCSRAFRAVFCEDPTNTAGKAAA